MFILVTLGGQQHSRAHSKCPLKKQLAPSHWLSLSHIHLTRERKFWQSQNLQDVHPSLTNCAPSDLIPPQYLHIISIISSASGRKKRSFNGHESQRLSAVKQAETLVGLATNLGIYIMALGVKSWRRNTNEIILQWSVVQMTGVWVKTTNSERLGTPNLVFHLL